MLEGRSMRFGRRRHRNHIRNRNRRHRHHRHVVVIVPYRRCNSYLLVFF